MMGLHRGGFGVGLGRVAAGVAVALAGRAWGQCHSDRVTASDRQSSDLFGASVDLTWNGSSNNLIVGAPREDQRGTDAGAVYCFTDGPGQWWEFNKLTASDGAAGDYFGSAVAVDGNSLLVAAPGAGTTGRVYLYDRFASDWAAKGTFTGAASGDGFGYSVSLDGNIAVVGAPYNDAFGADSGAAYLYERVSGTWQYELTLVAHHTWRHPGDWCGFSTAVDGQTVLVGIPNGDDWNSQDCGFVQTFTKTNGQWGLSGGLYAPDHQTGDDMGYSVAIEGNVAVVGAPGAAVDGKAEAGAVYVFRRTGSSWNYEQKIKAFPVYAGSRFGTRVAIAGGVIGVGTFANEWVYTFERNADGVWAQESRIIDPDPGTDKFGGAIAMDGGRILIGDYQADDAGLTDNGAAYVFPTRSAGGDVCIAAEPVVEGSYLGCTTNATVMGSPECVSGLQIAPEVHFSYVAPATGTVRFDTFGSSFDTVLSVHTGCPANSLNSIACNDDWSIFEQTSHVQVHVQAGHEYIVRLSGVDGARGSFAMHVSALTPDPCRADFNGDGALNTLDFIAFLNAWNANNPSADMNGDGTVNTIDVLVYLNAFTAGC